MKLISAIVSLAMLFCCGQGLNAKESYKAEEKAAKGVITRTIGHFPKNVVLEVTSPLESGEYFSTEAVGGKLTVRGSSAVAVCRGFYDFVTSNGYGMVTWTVNNINLPARFPDSQLKVCTTPFTYRQYYNVCTYGYTTAYWGWEEWEKELDRMALHGVNMVLSPIGSEAIFARVWRKLGLTEEEIGEFITGPAHLPWFRMGNMSELGGNLSQGWYDKTIALEHKLIDRMSELGISPIFNAFAGFVPKGIKRVFPDAELMHTGWDNGPFYVSSFIFPETELFQLISREYLAEWEKEFGKGEFYLADSFNEMKVPFAPKGTQERFSQIASYGKSVYNSISQVNPDAVWVMQGWIFGYQRNIWDPESIRALLSEVPDDKMMLLDLSVDFNYGIWESEYTWNHAKGLYGKQWIYSTVPNFGGRTCTIGDLDFYLNGHLNALSSPNKGNLVGYGTAPEGIENNEVLYEILTTASWSTSHQDINEWLKNYSANRYGSCPDGVTRFWDKMLSSAYGFSSSQAMYRIQRQPYFARGGRYSVSKEYFEGLESFISCADALSGSEAYMTDLALYGGYYAFGKAEVLVSQIHEAYVEGDGAEAAALEDRFFKLMAYADRLFDANKVTRLQRWIDFARSWGDTEEEKDKYELDARRLVTVWGEGGHHDGLDDYSCRMWSGLIRDYYVPRWKHYFDSRKENKPFDFDAWEYKFAEPGELSPAAAVLSGTELVEEAKALVAYAADIVPQDSFISGWSSFDMKDGNTRIVRMITPEEYVKLKGIRLVWARGEDSVNLKLIQINGASKMRFKQDNIGITLGEDNPVVEIPVTLKEGEVWKFNYLHIGLADTKEFQDSQVKIEYIF